MTTAPETNVDQMGWRQAVTPARSSVEEVSTRLKNLIHIGTLGPGDRLPPERELCELLSISRSTLREALSALRADGYIEARRGSGGGTFITRLDEPYSRWIQMMRADPERLQDIIDVRKAVECEVSRLAAERLTPEALKALRATVELSPTNLNPRAFREADAQFHSLLADAARNLRLKILMTEARGEQFAPASALLIDSPTMMRSQEEHAAILDAVASRDADLAGLRMREHLSATFDDVQRAIFGPTLKPTAKA